MQISKSMAWVAATTLVLTAPAGAQVTEKLKEAGAAAKAAGKEVGKAGAPFVVGDDDQSIYRWRGAKVENMQHFRREYGATVYKLERNYRSTPVILAAANAVIAKNTDRMGKELWTAAKGGEPIRVYAAFNERDEADFVIDRIRDHQRRGLPLAAAAVLYRSNAQSRAFEEALMAARIPYRVYGGLRFFERAEIKDALSYLRLTQSRDDDIAFERVVNLPARGIGGATLELLRNDARDNNRSLWRAGHELESALPSRAAGALRGFFALIDRLAVEITEQPLHEQVRHVIEKSGLRDHHAKEKDNKGEARVENLDELVNAAEAFTPEGDDGLSPLGSFLAHATLESGETQAATGLDCVQLMTLHAAKGLEFPTVFLVGLEEGLFPSEHSAFDADRLPEERRRGMTIDVGYAHLTLPDGTELDFVDVPGHDRLVGNMLVGAGEIDAALLVVAADDGVRAQTLEHLALLDALDVRHAVVAVTKTDLVPTDRITDVTADLATRLASTTLAASPILPVSATTGDSRLVSSLSLRRGKSVGRKR